MSQTARETAIERLENVLLRKLSTESLRDHNLIELLSGAYQEQELIRAKGDREIERLKSRIVKQEQGWRREHEGVQAERDSLKAELAKYTERRFPIMLGGPSIPWSLIAPHEKQAQSNHYQTLERLAERGGLSPCEAVAILEDRKWREMDQGAARARLIELAESDVRKERDALKELLRTKDTP